MKRPGLLVVITVAVVLVGGALLKGFGDPAASDPVASVDNGAPRGLLGLALLLRAQGRTVDVVRTFDERVDPAPGDIVLVAPPEKSGWTDAEADDLLSHVTRGAHLVLACDDEEPRNQRLKALLLAAGVECARADVAIGDEASTRALAALPGSPTPLYVRGTGRVRPRDAAPVFPAWSAGADPVVVKRPLGAGSITVLGSATPIANDGLARDANAAFALRELAPAVVEEQHADGAPSITRAGRVIVDERHHRSRSRAAVVSAAAKGWGPLTALAALALLVPFSLLMLAPRPGDAPRIEEERRGAPAAEAQARALAALLVHAAEPAHGALQPGVDPEAARRRSSRHDVT